MVCKNCNQELDNNYAFCPHCGKPLQQNETVNIRPVINKAKQAVNFIYKDPAVREIVDDVKTIVVDSITDKKNRTMRDVSKKAKKTTTQFMKKIGLKEKNILDHIVEGVKKK